MHHFQHAFCQGMVIYGIEIPVLPIRRLIADKKAVGRPKDQLDVINLERILQQRESDDPAPLGSAAKPVLPKKYKLSLPLPLLPAHPYLCAKFQKT